MKDFQKIEVEKKKCLINIATRNSQNTKNKGGHNL